MNRLSTLIFAGVAASAVLAPTALQARSAAPYFTVELVQEASDSEAIAGGVVFRCEGTTCTAPRSGDRALRVCSQLRREVGTIASFNVAGEAMSEADLARCNG